MAKTQAQEFRAKAALLLAAAGALEALDGVKAVRAVRAVRATSPAKRGAVPSAAAPLGLKADGTPRRKPGRKPKAAPSPTVTESYEPEPGEEPSKSNKSALAALRAKAGKAKAGGAARSHKKKGGAAKEVFSEGT